MELDKLDRKILFELDKNSRLSYQKLGRIVHASKEVVGYRVQRLIKEKVINNFHTIISLTSMGYFNHKIYFQLHGLTDEKQQMIIQKLKQNKEVVWIAICEGRWDLMISFYAKNIQEFAVMKAGVFEMMGDFIQEYAIVINEDGFMLHRDYLQVSDNHARHLVSYLGEVRDIKLDEKERKLLQTISTNSRLPIIEIAKVCNYSMKTVVEKIQVFKKNGLIQTFTLGLNLSAINYFSFKIFIYLNDFSNNFYTLIFNFCKEFMPVRHIIKTVGPWELELEIETPNPKELQSINKILKNKFPDKIKKIELVTVIDEIKLEFFPQILIL